MRTTSNKSHIYIGKQAGLEIIKEIKNAKKSVKIVSPYTSPDYVKNQTLVVLEHAQDLKLLVCVSIKS